MVASPVIARYFKGRLQSVAGVSVKLFKIGLHKPI